MIRSTITVTALLLALASCQDQQSVDENDNSVSADVEATSSEESVSILRPDVVPPAELRLTPLELRIGFPDGGAQLSAAAVESLQEAIQSPQISQGGAIVLRGHSDAAGSDRVNLDASLERAEAVKAWLIENGVDADRISVIAFGEQNPIEPNALPDGSANDGGRAVNRRVDMTVLATLPESDTAPTG